MDQNEPEYVSWYKGFVEMLVLFVDLMGSALSLDSCTDTRAMGRANSCAIVDKPYGDRVTEPEQREIALLLPSDASLTECRKLE